MEKSRSWPSAHDWKSCIPQKGIEGSNPSFSAIKEPSPFGGGSFFQKGMIRIAMSFTSKLFLAYLLLGTGAVIAQKRKQKAIGAVLILVIVASILILGYLWVTSPM